MLSAFSSKQDKISVVGRSMIESWREVKDVAELEQNHVRPNMGMMLRRGVWFPTMPEIQ
jgi:hypothetical protein